MTLVAPATIARILGPLLERRCQACGRVAPGRDMLCPDCAERLAPRLSGYCPGCGELAGEASAPVVLCPRCEREPRPWSAIAFHGPYDDLLQALVLRFKFGPDLGLGALLRTLLVGVWERSLLDREFDLVTVAPMHDRRLLTRGFNQSLELARPLARRLGVPLAPRALARARPTTPQARLTRDERLTNLRGAFTADADHVAGKRVLVVDDVVTTGATLEECARALGEAGATDVAVIALARA